MTVSAALEEALAATEVLDQDVATVALARAYASAIDLGTEEGDELAKLGPKFLACLEHLLMSPKARASVVKGKTNGPTASPLDELRARRRKRDAPPVDPSTGGTDA